MSVIVHTDEHLETYTCRAKKVKYHDGENEENVLPDTVMEDDETIFKKPKMPCVCLLYTSPSPRDATLSRMPSSA